MFKESLKHKYDEQWINLILVLLKVMGEILVNDLQSVLKHVNKFNFMEDALQLPSIATELGLHINIVSHVLKCFILLLQANVKTQKKKKKKKKRAAQFLMTMIHKEIIGLPFGKQKIELLLWMIFETTDFIV